MFSRNIASSTSKGLKLLGTRLITTSSTVPKKVYTRTTTSSTTIKPNSTPTRAAPIKKLARSEPIVSAAAVAAVAEVKPSTVTVTAESIPNWSSADEFDHHQLEFSNLEQVVVDPLPEIPLTTRSTTTRSTASTTAASPFPSISSEFPTTPFPTASVPLSSPSPSPSSTLAQATTPLEIPIDQQRLDWTTSFHGISSQPFSERAAEKLMRPLVPAEIEIKPDGLLYLPEILYRRILNQAFGPGGWGMVPRGEMTVLKMMVSREWGLVANGRLVSVSRGEQTFFDPSGLPTATEGCKSNALMRCCKDLGIASEMWDPAFIRVFKANHCVEAWTEHAVTKKRARRWRKKGNKFEYPLVESKMEFK